MLTMQTKTIKSLEKLLTELQKKATESQSAWADDSKGKLGRQDDLCRRALMLLPLKGNSTEELRLMIFMFRRHIYLPSMPSG